MKFSFAPFIACLTIASMPAIAANEMNDKIEQLCATEHMLIKHSVNIGQANAVAGNRAQHYQIQPALTEQQKANLKTTQVSLGDDCLEFLSQQDVLSIDTEGVIARVYFNFDNSDLTQASKLTLTALAKRMQSLNEVPKLNVVGHTDNVGSESYNQELGKHRAMSSKVFLVESGVEKEVLQPHSEGFNKPLRDNQTEQGRATNRRVEIVVAESS
ncbi:OmpA family protein [Vibrio neonatus]|uniref:OmpA family protein n=1 Tax=Vibrio neonatus TaxID=278860 RepID=UPI0021C43940|nr:OmpA family protein [Vibrio neonatus]